MADPHRVHIISDSTGETLAAMLRATVAMFRNVNVTYRRHVMIRSETALDAVLKTIAEEPGIVFHTMVDAGMREKLEARCSEIGVEAVAILEPLISVLSRSFDQTPKLQPGAQHVIDEQYHRRISALEFALAADDGSLSERLEQADVILIGVSRTSKTPTCVYLAGQGVMAANVPLVMGFEMPRELSAIDRSRTLIVGLTAKPTRIAQIRELRMSVLGHETDEAYADLGTIREEIVAARRMMEALDVPVIDVTRRSVEETAAQIRRMLEAMSQEQQV